jgi:hypothetical protein
VGPPRQFALFGLSLTGEGSRPGTRLLTADTGVVTDVGTSPITYVAHRIGRVNALLGLRQINFVRVDGLDALTAAQDVPTGFQLGTQIGRSAPLLGGEDADVSIAGDLYLGTIRGRSTFRLQLQGEGRRALGRSAWDDVLTTGRATQYFQRTPSHLHQTVLEWSGGYRQRVPFQLLLGIPNGGVRGYEEASFAGARRLVVRSEERWSFANVDQLADAGVALFADVGRQWAGDAPYGVTTPVKASVGFSLLAAVPPRSARTWRADVAFPVTGGTDARWTLRFTNGDRTTFEFRNPSDVADRRAPTVPTSLFAWP